MTACDVAVIGAGPAGSTCAARLAQSGMKVILLERDQFPRDKLCGEFLSPESTSLLDQLGFLPRLLQTSPPTIEQALFTSPLNAVRFSLPAPALGVPRIWLDAAMAQFAEECGAEVRFRATVRRVRFESDVVLEAADGSEIRCKWAVGAYGRQSYLDSQLRRSQTPSKRKMTGLKRHHSFKKREDVMELRGCCEIHIFAGGYCGISLVDSKTVNVCMLIDPRRINLRGAWSGVCEQLRQLNPHLRKRLSQLVVAEPVMHSVAGIGFEPRTTSTERVLFAGDCAGMIAPLCGDGQAMAIESGLLLADFLVKTLRKEVGNPSLEWDKLWNRTFAARLALGRNLQNLLLQRAGMETALAFTRTFPATLQYLFGSTRGPLMR